MNAIQLIKSIFVKNSAGAVINPATNEKLDEVITAIGSGGGGGGGGNVGVLDELGTRINPATEETLALIPSNMGKLVEKIPDVTGVEVLNYFSFDLEGGDFVTTRETANGQNITALVIDPTTDNKRSIISSLTPVKANAHLLAIEASVNIRSQHQYSSLEMSSNEAVAPYTVFGITTLQQTTLTLTLTMTDPVDWTIGDWINIAGCADNRLNYPNFCIASISANMLVVTGTASGEAGLPSLTVGPISTVGMTAQKRRQLRGQDGYGMRISGSGNTQAAFLSKFSSNITKVTGTLIGQQFITVGGTVPVFTNPATGQVDIKTFSKFFFRSDSDGVWFGDRAIDSSAIITSRNYFSGVKPSWQKDLYMKFNAISPQSMTRPIAKIISIVKTGTTTATVTTDVPHGLLTTNYVTIKGVRDQTNFPVLTTATVVASTPTTTTFTIVIGGAVTSTSYGGSVILANGQVDQPGIMAPVGQSITSDATTGFVTIVGSGGWVSLNIGEYTYLHGFRDNITGADLGYDGAWEVVTISGTTLVVKPIYNYLGVRISPTFTTLGTTNCGGTVILMTTLRSHDIVLKEYSPSVTQIDGQGTLDITKAIPTYPVGGTQAVSGTVTSIQGTAGATPWLIRGNMAGIADIASAAITTTSTTASIANDLGNSFQVTIPVTVVTGTNPTMDVRIEESFDGGTNWVTLYEFQRIIATGSYNSPILRATGRNIRYVQTLSGTTPSFTRAITRNVLPFHNAEPQKRLFDRTIAVNTLNSTSTVLFGGASNNVQLVVNMGAVTVAPIFKIQGSEDNLNWYDISTPLTSIASSTVSLTVVDNSNTFVRAIVSTAGTGATLGYLSLKSWS